MLHKLPAQTLQTPNIIPPSPTAQAFMRYGEIPVDYSTGVPNIDIPIYSVEGKKLSFPISVSYHASGIKVNDIPSEIGLGWVVNGSGMISRSVNGKRDETMDDTRSFKNAQHLYDSMNARAYTWDRSCCCLRGIMDFEYFLNNNYAAEDVMRDRYFYKLPNGVSGVFTYDFLNFDSLITLPYRPLKVKKTIEGVWALDKRIKQFDVTDGDGTVYTFKSYFDDVVAAYSEWYLTQMVSADCSDTISFNYATANNYTAMQSKSYVYMGFTTNEATGCAVRTPSSFVTSTVAPAFLLGSPALVSIVSSKTIIKFSYVNDRQDFSSLRRLHEIIIAPRTASANNIRTIRFKGKYFGTTNESRRMGLDSIIVSDAALSAVQKYAFTYESTALPDYPGKTSTPRFNEDYWGYYNGANATYPIPRAFISNEGDKSFYGANRDADASGIYSKACMLKEIKYPTGGRTVFQFEPHGSNAGGLRVASIINYSSSNDTADMKTYDYGGAPLTRQFQSSYFRYNQVFVESSTTSLGSACWSRYSREVVLENALLPLEVAPGMQAMYPKVTEYNGTRTRNTGKTVYSYNEPYSPSEFFNNPDHPVFYELEMFYHPYHYDKGNYRPEMTSKKVYSFDGTNYHPVSEEVYEYSKLFTKMFNTGFKISRPTQYASENYFSPGCAIIDPGSYIYDYITSIVAIDTKAYREASLLTRGKKYVFDPLDSTKYVLTSTDFIYNPQNLGVKDKTVVSSAGKVLKTSYKYPADITGLVYDTMVKRNMVTPVVEQTDVADNQLLQTTQTLYKNWGNKVIAPENIVVNRNADKDSIIRYTYDTASGNLTGIKEKGVNAYYLWGYNRSYPIAKIQNAAPIAGNAIRGWSGYFNYMGTLSQYQTVALNGSCSFPQQVSANISRHYYKGDHQATFTVYIYDASHRVLKSYVDVMPASQTELWVYDQLTVPAGSYTVEVSVTYASGGSYGKEIEVSIDGSASVPAAIPFHTSFEDDQQDVTSTYSKTGRKCHTGYYTLVLPPCPADNNNFIVSYWSKASAAAPWTLVRQNITVPASGYIMNIGSDGGYVDEVRVYSAQSLMYTYTYDPLIGVTSETDPADRTTYYEYDSFGRLSVVRDDKGMVIKKICYNYSGQQVNCN